MITLQNVDLRFGDKRILHGFCLTLPKGQTTCLLGPSGCGKTTLMRIASGLLKPDSGHVIPPRERCSFVFQEDRLLPWFDALENLTLLGIEKAAAMQALEQVLLAGEAHTMPDALSGGMRRRLAISRALAYGADTFFLDEPLRGLDPTTAAPVLEATQAALSGKTALLITHRPEEAMALGHRLVLVDGPPVRILREADICEFTNAEALREWLLTTSLPQQ